MKTYTVNSNDLAKAEKGTMLVVSFAHMPPDDRDAFSVDPTAPRLLYHGFCYVASSPYTVIYTRDDEHDPMQVLPWLQRMLDAMELLGCDYLRFETDGPVYPCFVEWK